jgi:hypothetical protein
MKNFQEEEKQKEIIQKEKITNILNVIILKKGKIMHIKA